MKRQHYYEFRFKVIVILTIALLSCALILGGEVLHPLYILLGAFVLMIIASYLIPTKDEGLRRAKMDS